MRISGLHVLLTYQCTLECDHCFVWGSPRQRGTLPLQKVEHILQQAREAGVERIYFEGGEPFLFYAILVESVKIAAGMGFHVGVVTNAYWALSVPDAVESLKPLAALENLSISTDLYHSEERVSATAQNAVAAAKWLHIPTRCISIQQPEREDKAEDVIMYRCRAARNVAPGARNANWQEFNECPPEDLREPGRVHLDPFGNLHICQGLIIGNLFERPLREICETYSPDLHPICGPLLSGGPAALVTEYNVPHSDSYADACQLCYESRLTLRPRFPELLGPDAMYGAGL